MRDRRSRALAAVFVASLFVTSAVSAQDAIGHLDDASTPPKGLLRIRAAAAWTRYDQVFSNAGVSPLAAALNSPALGASNGFGLAGIQTQIQDATGSPFTLSLGRARLSATGREEVVPIGIEYGVTNRLSVGVVIPIMRKRVATQFRFDTVGSGANVGPNPNRTSTVAQNASVQTQFSAAVTQLQNRMTFCTNSPSSPGCSTFSQSAAQALIASSQTFATTIGTLYGTSTGTGAAFVPMTQSAAQAAIALRVAAFNAQFKSLLASSTDLITAIPKGAGGPAGAADFQSYVVGDLGRDSLNTQERLGIGDLELGVKMRLIDFPKTERRRFGAQLAVAGSVRLPTGSSQSRSEIIDMRLGNGATMLDTRALLDLQVGRVGLLAAAQFATLINGDTVEYRPYGKQRVELDFAPRFHLSPPLSIHGAYSIRQTESAGDQLVGGGVTYSTLAGFNASGAVPIEMRFTHLEGIKGDAGRPKFFRDQIEVRLYRRLR